MWHRYRGRYFDTETGFYYLQSGGFSLLTAGVTSNNPSNKEMLSSVKNGISNWCKAEGKKAKRKAKKALRKVFKKVGGVLTENIALSALKKGTKEYSKLYWNYLANGGT